MTAFEPGDRVRVRASEKPGHVRTPGYLKGKEGKIDSVLGKFRSPEDLAYGLSGEPERPLYKVEFLQTEVWDGYQGSASDRLYADVYEQWLERGGGAS
ncbi:MAG TPA: SH3-like domain-containing protein [Rubrobacteraceae bacterium]|nr:SH3-like domain-containing protein [Rubrobacteraceae bacterium]